MKIFTRPSLMTQWVNDQKSAKRRLGFVPTMGALHDGHLSLIRAAAKECDSVAVSIFVNPKQFAKGEDFKVYPRTLKADLRLCSKAGVDAVFHPSAASMFSADFSSSVEVRGLGDCLCGLSRPGHFQGVALVVAKLFNILQPDMAYFGQKDAQQVAVIKRMVLDLNFPVRIRVCPILREPDGLALSSRNRYLNLAERADAPWLYRSLKLARSLINSGRRESGFIKQEMRRLINQARLARIEYIALVNPDTLKPIEHLRGKVLIALAVRIGKTRLIDNMVVNI